MNTEEIMSDIKRVNESGLPANTVIGSTDIKAIYIQASIYRLPCEKYAKYSSKVT